MSTHTKGPWKVEQHEGQIEIWSGNHFIATTSHDLFFSAKKHGFEQPNANLIAAAPELLEELEKAHIIIRNALNIMTTKQQGRWEELNYRDDVKDGWAVTREGIRREAIAKAKGISKRDSK